MKKNTTLYAQLKECKTIREMYQVLGEERLEKGIFLLLCAWALVPIASVFSHFFWSFRTESLTFREAVFQMDYWEIVQYLGLLTFTYAVIYLYGRLAVFKKQANEQISASMKKISPWNKALLIMLFWACVCTCFSADIRTSILGSDYRHEGILMYFVYSAIFFLAQHVKKKNYRILYFRIFSIVATVLAIICVLQDYNLFGLSNVFIAPWATVFFHFNHLGYYFSLSILCTIGLFVLDDTAWWRVFYVISIYVQFWGILVNSTFASYLGICVGVIAVTVLFFIWSKNRTDRKQIMQNLWIVWILFLGTMFMSYMDWIPSSSGENMRVNSERMIADLYAIIMNIEKAAEAGYDGAGHGRLYYWVTGVKMLLLSPIVGYGPEMYHPVLGPTMWTNRVDLEILQYGVFFGFPGMLLYVFSLVSLAYTRMKQLIQLSPTVLIAGGCVISYMVSSCFGNSMFYTAPYFWIVLGIVSAEQKLNS